MCIRLGNTYTVWVSFDAEPSPESRQQGGFTFVRGGFTFVKGGLDIKIWKKFH